MNKQQRRQSSDFKEIWNVQTDMKVTADRWAQIFHNWDDPDNCEAAKKIQGCVICDALREHGIVMRVSDEKVFYKPEHW